MKFDSESNVNDEKTHVLKVQEANAFLRERYLYLLSAMSGK